MFTCVGDTADNLFTEQKKLDSPVGDRPLEATSLSGRSGHPQRVRRDNRRRRRRADVAAVTSVTGIRTIPAKVFSRELAQVPLAVWRSPLAVLDRWPHSLEKAGLDSTRAVRLEDFLRSGIVHGWKLTTNTETF